MLPQVEVRPGWERVAGWAGLTAGVVCIFPAQCRAARASVCWQVTPLLAQLSQAP